MNGGPADGDSLAPTISEDGKWVAFWSAADNLVDGFNNICQQGGTGVTCLNIYLYNLETGKIEGIPVQYIPGDPVFGVDRISLSADGRYVGFTASSAVLAGTPSVGSSLTFNTGENSSSDMVVNISNIVHSSEAVVYDRETGEYELENQAQDGTAGDGKSSSPVLSANGRFVAFTSTSTNLVAGDTHNYIDVFLRDRETGNVELISVSTVGWKGRGDSGVNLWGWGYYGLNISRDGRYVVFESTASNLGQDLNDECSNLDFNNCNYLYIHDTQTGVTDWINALPSPNYSLFPEISSDGRWVTFMQTFTNCSSSQLLCSNVMLYDRQRGWTTNLTKFNEESPMLSWSYSGSLELPWEAWESNALVFSPDGKLIALGGTDSKIRIWQFSNSSNSISYNQAPNIVEAGINDSFTTLAFTQNGEWLAAGTAGGVIYVWRMADEKLLYSLKDQTDPIKDLVFSQDGAHMVFSTINRVWVWSIGSGDLILENSFSYGGIAVYAIDISPRGNTIASARGDGSIWLQSLPNGKVIGRLGPSDLTANSLAFSEDGSLLATRSSGGTINVWQLGTTGSVTPSITLINTSQFYSNIGALAFSPDNKYLISTGMVGELTLWSVPEGKIFTLSPSVPNGWIYSLAFSKGGNKLAAIFENEIMLWQVPSEVASSFYVHATMDNYVDSKPLPEATANDIPMLIPLQKRVD